MKWPQLGPAFRRIFVTHCLGCCKRLHAPNEDSLKYRTEQHARNCNGLKQMALRKAAKPMEKRE